VFVKVCGTTSEEDALLSVAMGADALGFIFAPSKRQVTAERASDIIKRLPPDILTVGVFRNESLGRMAEIVAETGVKAVQLHGSESPSTVAETRHRLGRPVIKAFVAGSKEMRTADTYGAEIVLLDAPSPGSGQVFDWRLAEGVPDVSRLVLAGGLDSDNVAEAIESVRPWGVDVVSGVEARPGQKDPRKVRTFIENAKAAAPAEYQATGATPYDWEYE
jgi:phosphoribosylanthranilate isomerase